MRTASLLVLALLGAACAPAALPTSSRASPIYWGEPEDGYPGVVQLSIAFGALTGAMCSGTLVSPRVVVTAQHCTVDEEGEPLEPSAIVVRTGWEGGAGEYGVEGIRTPEAAGMTGSDIAVLVLSEELVSETHRYAIAWEPHPGDPVTLVGYGQDEDGGSGRKRIGDNEVDYVFDTYFTTVGEPGCHGDSGGPAFDADGVLVGVIVNTLGGWVGEDTCLSGVSGLTRVDAHHELVDGAVEDAWVCDDADGETCGDGRDNDCNMLVDDACLDLGAPCADPVSCESGDCRELGGVALCSTSCELGAPDGCPAGFYCDEVVCGEGACVAGEAGGGSLGDACSADSDCENLSCLSVGGEPRCLRPCTVETGCAGGEDCADPDDDGCGGCVSDGEGAPFGAPCVADADCASGSCVEDAFGSLCSAPCAAGCPEGFECDPEDQCVRASPGGARDGSPCASRESCESGECTDVDGRLVCTGSCDAAGACPAGFECVEDRCVPSGAIDGEVCADDEDCLSGLCGRFDGFRACTEACGEEAPCGSGLVCQLADDGGWCRPRVPPAAVPADEDGGGCGCRAAGSGDSVASWLVIALLATLIGMLRRRGAPWRATADPNAESAVDERGSTNGVGTSSRPVGDPR